MADDLNPMIEEELVLPRWCGRPVQRTLTVRLLESLLEDDPPTEVEREKVRACGDRQQKVWLAKRGAWRTDRPRALVASAVSGKHAESDGPNAQGQFDSIGRSPQIDAVAAREALADAASIILSMDLPGAHLIRTYLTRALPAYACESQR
jgi:hypothetical protein